MPRTMAELQRIEADLRGQLEAVHAELAQHAANAAAPEGLPATEVGARLVGTLREIEAERQMRERDVAALTKRAEAVRLRMEGASATERLAIARERGDEAEARRILADLRRAARASGIHAKDQLPDIGAKCDFIGAYSADVYRELPDHAPAAEG